MSKILRNDTGLNISISDTGITIQPGVGNQYTIQPQDYLLWAASNDIITEVGAGNIVVNDGSSDLSISDGVDLIKGIFPNPVGVQGSDGTQIGNINDRLKTDSEVTISTNSGDAFNRLRSSTPTVIFDAAFVENDRSLFFTEEITGGGSVTYDTQNNHIELSVGTTSGDKVIRQTKQYIRYIPGQSNLIELVGIFEPKTNTKQKIGYHDGSDGFFFQMEDNTFSVVICNSISGSPVETKIDQGNFSEDNLDGNGDSGITIDLTKVQIFVIDFQWLGAGTIRFGVFIEGKLIYFHKQHHANSITASKYMRTGSLPLRWEIENTGTTASATTLIQSCMSVLSEGDTTSAVIQRSVSTDNSRSLNTSTKRPVISVRLNSTSETATIRPKGFKLLAATNDDILVELVLGGTLTGASWQNVGTDSVAEYDVTATAHTGGIVLETTFVAKNGSDVIDLSNTFLSLAKELDGTLDILTLRAISLTSSANAYGAITFEEVY